MPSVWRTLDSDFWDATVPDDYFAPDAGYVDPRRAVLLRVGRVVGRGGVLDPALAGDDAWLQVRVGARDVALTGAAMWAYVFAPGDPASERYGWGTAQQIGDSVAHHTGLDTGERDALQLVEPGLLVPVTGDPELVRAAARLFRVTASAGGYGDVIAEERRSQDLRFAAPAQGEDVLDAFAQTIFDGAAYGSLLEAARAAQAVLVATGQLSEEISLGELINGVLAKCADGTITGMWRLEPARSEDAA